MPIFNFTDLSKNDIVNQTGDPPSGSMDSFFPDGNDALIMDSFLGNNQWVSARAALKNPDLFSIINLMSNDLANVMLKADKSKAQGIIDHPSTNASYHGFWQSVWAQLLIGGEAFAYRWRNANGNDVKWEYLRPSQVSTFYFEYENGMYYNITFEDPKIPPLFQVPQSDILHFRLFSIDGGRSGMSPLISMNDTLSIKRESNRLTMSSLRNAMNANGVLKVQNGGLLDDKTKAARSRRFMKTVRNSNGGPLVLDDLETYTPLEIKTNVAQLLSQTDWTSKQFAKVYGIPDTYVGGQGDQQSSLDQIKGLYAHALKRYLSAVVSELEYKQGTKITTDMRQVVDPLGESMMTSVANLVRYGTLAQSQGLFVLQKAGFVENDLPEPKNMNPVITSVKGTDLNEVSTPVKGGD